MTGTKLKTMREQMVENSDAAVSLMWFASHAAEIEAEIEEATSGGTATFSRGANLIALAHTAFRIADVKAGAPPSCEMLGAPAAWFRAKAMTLLEIAIDALSMAAAAGKPAAGEFH